MSIHSGLPPGIPQNRRRYDSQITPNLHSPKPPALTGPPGYLLPGKRERDSWEEKQQNLLSLRVQNPLGHKPELGGRRLKKKAAFSLAIPHWWRALQVFPGSHWLPNAVRDRGKKRRRPALKQEPILRSRGTTPEARFATVVFPFFKVGSSCLSGTAILGPLAPPKNYWALGGGSPVDPGWALQFRSRRGSGLGLERLLRSWLFGRPQARLRAWEMTNRCQRAGTGGLLPHSHSPELEHSDPFTLSASPYFHPWIPGLARLYCFVMIAKRYSTVKKKKKKWNFWITKSDFLVPLKRP